MRWGLRMVNVQSTSLSQSAQSRSAVAQGVIVVNQNSGGLPPTEQLRAIFADAMTPPVQHQGR